MVHQSSHLFLSYFLESNKITNCLLSPEWLLIDQTQRQFLRAGCSVFKSIHQKSKLCFGFFRVNPDKHHGLYFFVVNSNGAPSISFPFRPNHKRWLYTFWIRCQQRNLIGFGEKGGAWHGSVQSLHPILAVENPLPTRSKFVGLSQFKTLCQFHSQST